MGSRMEKYDIQNASTSRLNKNKNLYEEIDRIDVGYIDLNEPNVLEIPSNGRAIKTREDYKKYHDLSGILNIKEEEHTKVMTKEKEKRIYDIDEILKKAKEELHEEENKKRLLNTEYNILTKLDLSNIEKLEENELKEDELKKIVEEAYPKRKRKEDFKDLFDDLKEETIKEEIFEKATSDVKIVDSSLKEEEEKLQKTIIDTGYDTELIDVEKTSKLKVFIIIFVILLIGFGSYLLLNYFNII